jgi:hypothetical protein
MHQNRKHYYKQNVLKFCCSDLRVLLWVTTDFSPNTHHSTCVTDQDRMYNFTAVKVSDLNMYLKIIAAFNMNNEASIHFSVNCFVLPHLQNCLRKLHYKALKMIFMICDIYIYIYIFITFFEGVARDFQWSKKPFCFHTRLIYEAFTTLTVPYARGGGRGAARDFGTFTSSHSTNSSEEWHTLFLCLFVVRDEIKSRDSTQNAINTRH